MKRAQSSIEASMVITFMIFVFVAFMGLFAKRALDTQYYREIDALESVAEIIKREVMLADKVEKGYTRNFTLPYRAGEFRYNVTLINYTSLGTNYSEVIISALNASSDMTTVTLLPVKLGGRFCAGVGTINIIEKQDKRVHVSCKIFP